jgi:hypothetical protein
VLVPGIITPGYNLSGVRFVFLDCGIRQHADIIVDVEIEQWSGLATSLVDDEVIKGVMLMIQ